MRRTAWQAVCLVHLLAAWAVGQLPDETAKNNESQAAVARALAEALKDPDVEVRRSAVLSLSRIGPGAEPATSALVEALKDTDVEVRGPAAVALGRIGPKAAGVVPGLIALLKDSDHDVRGAAALALARIGNPAASAVPALLELTGGEDKQNQVLRGVLWRSWTANPKRMCRLWLRHWPIRTSKSARPRPMRWARWGPRQKRQ